MSRNKYPEVTVEKILDVSQRLFYEKGYEKTSIQDIVNELGGLSKGAIYHHFKSKEDILCELEERIFKDNNPFAVVEKEKNLNDAIQKMSELKEIKVEKVSSFITTEPWGYTEQEEFLNGALKIKTTFSPKELVRALSKIESEMKRERSIKWGPRIIDLDVIFYGDLISDDEEIIGPHPRMEEREFVLKPLSEICPYKIHPVLRKSVVRLLDELKSE